MSFFSTNSVYRVSKILGLLLMTAVFVVFSGCGTNKADVKGHVTFKGQPLTSGAIQIQSAKGAVFSGEIQSDGTFVVRGVPVGPAKVAIAATDPSAGEWNKQLAMKMREGKSGAKPSAQTEQPKQTLTTPAKYANFDQSGFAIEVVGPITERDFDLSE